MEFCCLDRYTALETALKEAEFTVAEVGREGKKTVITVFRRGALGENPGIDENEITTPFSFKRGL